MMRSFALNRRAATTATSAASMCRRATTTCFCGYSIFTSSSHLLSSKGKSSLVPVVSSSLHTASRCCHSSSSSSSNPSYDNLSDFEKRQLFEKRVAELDTKASCWLLSREDIEEVIDLLYQVRSGQIDLSLSPTVPEGSSSSSAGGAADGDKQQNTVLYIDPKNTEKAYAVPYAMSALHRCIFSYPDWHTLSVKAPQQQQPQPNEEDGILHLRRDGDPPRDIRYASLNLCSLPASNTPEGQQRRIFVLGSSEEKLELFRKEQVEKHGSFYLPKVAGYELFTFAGYALRASAAAAAANAGEGNNSSSAALAFGGISLNPQKDRFTLLANDPTSQLVANTICSGLFLETSLTLLKWLVEEHPGQGMRGQKAYFIALCCKHVLEDGTYFVFRDKDDTSFLFTSMHHLMLYKNLALATEAGRQEFERRGPWKILTTSGKNIVWKHDPKFGPVINPAVPEVSQKVPAFNIQFSREGIEQMEGIVKQILPAAAPPQQQPPPQQPK